MTTTNGERRTGEELQQERVRKLALSGKSLGEIAAELARDRTAIRLPDMQMPQLDMDTAIRLRWALRNIKGKRTKLMPVSPGDLRTLTEMGFVEMRDEITVLTNQGELAIK